jgi:spermidine synthase
VLPPLVASPGPTLPLRLALGAVLAWTPAAAAFGYAAPLITRAALEGSPRDAGTVGLLYACGTAGGAAACIAVNPWLVPVLGTGGATLLVALLLVLALPLAGRRLEAPWAVGLGAAFLAATLPLGVARAVGARLALRDDVAAVFAADSRYGRVRVDVSPDADALGRPRLRRLVIDGFVHGFSDPDDPAWLGYGYEGIYAAATDRLAPASGPPPRALFVGGGGCAFPLWLARERPGAAIDVVEIDPVVTRAAHEAMGLPDPAPFTVTHEDGRTFVDRRPLDAPPFDLVYADAFDDLSVPWHLATTEFVEALRRRMTPRGVVLWNLVDAAWSARFLGAVVSTLRQTFDHVVVLGPEEPGDAQETFVVVASDAPLDLEGLQAVGGSARGAPLAPVRRFSDAEIEEFVRAADGMVLRDDHAPVEALLAPVVRRRARR